MKQYYRQLFSKQDKVEYWNSIYDRQDFHADCYRQRINTALSWLVDSGLPRNSKILEVGCGAGKFVYEADRMGYEVLGVDYSHEMIAKANNTPGHADKINVSFLQADIESLPLADSSFDAIVCLGVISYLQSKDKALQELARVMKPGGVLVISILNRARLIRVLNLPFFLTKRLRKMILAIPVIKNRKGANHNAPSLTTYFIPKFKKSLELMGFAILETKTIPYELPSLFDKEIFPQELAIKTALFFEKFQNIPLIGSFGGMCVFKAVLRPRMSNFGDQSR